MINDLKELQHLLKLCRKQGVTAIDIGDCKITFGDLPQRQDNASEDEPMNDELTPEQLMYFSVGGAPGG